MPVGNSASVTAEWKRMTVPDLKLSPTQIKAYLHCKRRWGFEYLDGKRSAPSKYAQFGINGHKQLEKWFKIGEPPDQRTPEGLVALSGIHHWPAPQEVNFIEFPIETTTEVSRYYGFQDIGFQDAKTGLWVVGDHKFTGNFDYALSEEDPDTLTPEEQAERGKNGFLKTDVQSNVYARAGMDRHGVDRLELRWIYYRRVGAAKSKRVSLVVYRDSVEKMFVDKIDPAASEIHSVRAIGGVSGKDLPGNPRACDDYGGCPHLSYCEISPLERMRAAMADLTLKEKLLSKINPPESSIPVSVPGPVSVSAPAAGGSAMDRLRALGGSVPQPTLPLGRPVAAVAPVAAPAPVPTMPALSAQPVNPLLAKLKASQPVPGATESEVAAPAPVAPVAAPASTNPLLARLKASQPAAEPVAAPADPAPAPISAPAPTGNPLLDKLRAQATMPTREELVTAPASAPAPVSTNPLLAKLQASAPVEPVQAAPSINPLLAKLQASTALGAVAPDTSIAQAVVSAQDRLQQYPQGNVATDATRVFTLLINCRMVRPHVNFTAASDIVEEANRIICEELNVSDYSLVQFTAKGTLVSTVKIVLQQKLDSGAMVPGDTIVIFTGNRAESDCVEAFLAFSDRVIRS